MQITVGSKVTMHFSLTLADGTVAENSFDNEPVSFVLGDGALDKTLELALLGLVEGDRQTLTLMPGQAFGMPDPDAVNHVPRSTFPESMKLEEGAIIGFTSPDGVEMAGSIVSVGEEEVEIDFNHPLAGHEIEFTVEILSVDNPLQEQGGS